MASAVRPMALKEDESKVYFQVSFFHGFVEYDLIKDRVTRVVDLPIAEHVPPREGYILDSAHHGIALNGNENKLCVAGTMSDYAAIVSTRNFADFTVIEAGVKPYWSTTSTDGKYCYVSWSGTDTVSVISYRKEKEIARIPVGDHPQRVRIGLVRRSWLKSQR